MSRKQFDIYESRNKVFNKAHWICEHDDCMKPATQCAHRISKGKGNRQHIKNHIRDRHGRYLTTNEIDRIMHNQLNMAASCEKHNSNFNIANQPVKRDALIDEIWELIKEDL